MDIKHTFLGIWNIPVFIFCHLVVIVKNMYNLCNAGDQVSDFRALIFRMTCCRWEFEFNPLEQRKVCCIQSSGHECYPFCLSKKRCGVWSGRWGLGFCSVDSTCGGTEPLLSLSCGLSWDPSPLGTEVVAGVSLCWKSCPTLWCLPRFQLSNDSLGAQAAGEWALMGAGNY